MSAGRVSLAFRDIVEITPALVAELSKTCRVLDLTSNQISDLSPLRDMPDLEELILDDNKITSHTKFPHMPKLQNLWVNRNQINSLTFFIDKLEASCPSLIMLSMLNNEACPNYFNSGTPAQYQDYRYYVINRLPKLQVLDSTTVSTAERDEAKKKYGNLTSTTSHQASRRTIDTQNAVKKRTERELKAQEQAAEKVLRRQEEKREKKRSKKQTTASPAKPAPSPQLIQNNHAENLLPPELDSMEEVPSYGVPDGVRVLPPIPNRPPPPPPTSNAEDNGDWTSDDDDWSSSSDM